MMQLEHFHVLDKLVGTFFYLFSSIVIIVSAIFAYMTKNCIKSSKLEQAKKFVILSIIFGSISTLFIAFFCIINPNIINLRSILVANGNYELESDLFESGLVPFNGTEITCYASILGGVVICLIITILQYRVIKSILKADGTVKSTDFTEDFYDRL